MRPVLGAFLFVATSLLISSCGGGGGSGTGGGSGGTSSPEVTISAIFSPATRTVPGYADTLRITITPPTNITLPVGLPNPFSLTRGNSSVVINGLKPSAAPYLFFMEALTDGTVVGTVQRSLFVTAGEDVEVDVSANLTSLVSSVAIDGAPTEALGTNYQLTAHARDADGNTLFSGAGFAWTSTDPLVLFVDPDTGFAITREQGVVTVQATLKGTTLKGSLQITVTGDPFIVVSPSSPTVGLLGPQQFTAVATGLPNSNVNWSVDEPNGGSVSASGLYTAPATTGTYHVRATSIDSPSVSGTATVIVDEAWEIINLHPPGTSSSIANWVRDGQVGGEVAVDTFFHASLWPGFSNTWIDLTPAWAERAHVRAVYGGQQVGLAYTGSSYRAAVWSGTAASFVDLTPAGADEATVGGVYAGKQVGQSQFGGIERASVWSGSAASRVDLHPAGASQSVASDTYEDQQVGYATLSNVRRASLWTGTVASWVDLTPAGATDSLAFGVYAGVQVGQARIGGVERAGLWTGTSASWVELHPVGAARSAAFAIHDDEQVGYCTIGTKPFAAIWTGTSGSWRNLHSYLPSRFEQSVAHSIWHDGNTTYVAGEAIDKTTHKQEAILWVRTIGG